MRTYYHLEAMYKVFEPHLSSASIDRVIRYNFGVDFYGVLGWKVVQYKILPLYPFAKYWYKELDHFDQMDRERAVETFNAHKQWIFDIIDDEKFPLTGPEMIFRTLGRSTHAISDIYSHSNIMELMFDYFREDPDASGKVKSSGMKLNEYIRDNGPTVTDLLESPDFAAFRTTYLPKLFTFQSVPDTGPNCHEERALDWPTSIGSSKEEYVGIFEAAFQISLRELQLIIDNLFDRLKKENTSKYEMLNKAYRAPGEESKQPGPAAKRAKWVSDIFKVWD